MSKLQPATVDHRVRVQGQPVDDYPEFAPESKRGRVLRVTVVGEDILHRPCKEAVEFGTPELSQLIDDMFLTMYVAEGAGLAANQVDVDLRLFVYDCGDDDGVRHVGHILNPVIDDPAGRRRLLEAGEGCLSVPGPRHDLGREERTVVRGFDKDGNPLVIEGTGYFARCLQHETDHLNGMLYIDRLSKRQRRSVLQEMAEVKEGVFAERRTRAEAMGAEHLSVGG
ncbi:peptide deformylase [Streptomyces sp. NPDC048717]|uniref:peptide deformylase n=1 Tax=Streptomyces sp. NPDC048717 TaxID=3154928 RepID=UPI00342ED9B6